MIDRALVSKILAGEHDADLSDAESRALMDAIRTQPGVREELAQAEDDLSPLAEAYDPPLPGPEQWERVTAALRQELADNPIQQQPRRSGSRRRRSGMGILLALAAGVLAVVGATFLVNQGLTPGGSGDTTAALTMSPGSVVTDGVVSRVEALQQGEGFGSYVVQYNPGVSCVVVEFGAQPEALPGPKNPPEPR